MIGGAYLRREASHRGTPHRGAVMAWLCEAVEMIMQKYYSEVVAEQVVAISAAQYQTLNRTALNGSFWASMRLPQDFFL